MYLRHIVNDVQRITSFQQRMKFLMNTVIVQLKHIFLKELYPLLIPSNEKSVNFFNKEIVEILKSFYFLTLLSCVCSIFIAVIKAMLWPDVRELTCFT